MSPDPVRRRLPCCGGLIVLCAALAACSSPKPDPSPAPAAKSELWGELKPVVSVKELMKYMLDPVADNIFDAVGTEFTAKGMVDREPKTDEDWEKVRIGAVSLAEGAYLLKIARPFAPPGDENDTAGPNPVELTPAQITAKVERDPVEWNARIEALRNVALEVLEIANKKDASQLWGAGEDLDTACENCHKSYWYPGENADFYRRLNQRMEEHRQKSGADRKPSK